MGRFSVSDSDFPGSGPREPFFTPLAMTCLLDLPSSFKWFQAITVYRATGSL